MNGHRILVDTNILIMLVEGDENVAKMLEDCHVYVSVITEMEFLGVYDLRNDELKILEKLISDCTIVDINQDIKSKAIAIRRYNKMKLPDAIIASTAIMLDLPLVTADKDFKSIDDLALVLFEK